MVHITRETGLRSAAALALALLALASVSFWLSPPAQATALPQATVRYVSSVSGSDAGNDCAAPAAPCATLQRAVDQAAAGDEIRIATLDNLSAARYTGTAANVVAVGKSLTLRGGYVYVHPIPTMWIAGFVPAPVDGEQARRPLFVSGDVTVTLELLSFVNGSAERGGNVYAENATVNFVATPILDGSANAGGGLYLRNCRSSFDPGDWSGGIPALSGLLLVQGNRATDGGGVYVEGGAPLLAGLAVYSNSATANGGGLYLLGGQPVVAGGAVLENHADGLGGGLFLSDSAARIVAAGVYSNTAAQGGGLYVDGPLTVNPDEMPIVANSYIRHNQADLGGAMYFRQSVSGLVNNVIADNGAANGAALYLWGSSPLLAYNTVAQNPGGSGLYLAHRPGQAWPPLLPLPSLPFFANTIVVSHTVGLYVATTGLPYPFENRATLQGTLWWGNGQDHAGPGQVVHSTDISGDPRFTCTGELPDCLDPYHISTDSPAVDTGITVTLPLPEGDLFVDIDGQLRPSGQGYDIGADEAMAGGYGVWLAPPLALATAEPGQTITYTHRLMNVGAATDTYDLEWESSQGWSALVTGTPITLSAQTSATVQVRVSVPPGASAGMTDTTTLTAISRADTNVRAYALDLTTVVSGAPQADLAVDKRADVAQVYPGEPVRYTLVVTRAGSLASSLGVTLTDAALPAQAVGAWALPEGCVGDPPLGQVTCTLTLPGGPSPVTMGLTIVVTASRAYSGLLVNLATVSAAELDPNPADNTSLAVVAVVDWPARLYLPILLRGDGG